MLVPIGYNLREENSTQRPKAAADYGIQVDFSIDDEDPEDPAAALARLDKEVNDKTAEIERMAPNMKAMERYVLFSLSHECYWVFPQLRLDDAEMKLADTEREAEQARKESKCARDHFNDVKKRRCDLFNKAYNYISDRIDQV